MYSYAEVVSALQEWSSRPSEEACAQLRVVRIGTTVKGRAILMAVLGASNLPPAPGDATDGAEPEDQGPWAAPATPAAPGAAPGSAAGTPKDSGTEPGATPEPAPKGDDEGDTEENTPAGPSDHSVVLTLEPADGAPTAPEGAGPDAAGSDVPVLPALGDGPCRVFVICRQHGNEPAPTEAVMQFLQEYAATTDPEKLGLLRRVTFYVVPMLNADGAEAYERRNARNVDLNRDWVRQSQPETRAVVRAVRAVRPALVVDLHELHPTDWTPSFVEAMEQPAGTSTLVGDACNAAIAAVVGPLRAQSVAICARPVYNYREPRLAHRYFSVRMGIPSVLIETRRAGGVPLEARTAVHHAALRAIARYAAGEPLATPPRVIEAWLERASIQEYRAAQARRARAEQLARARAARRYRELASRGGSSKSVAQKRAALRKKLAARKGTRTRPSPAAGKR